MQLDSPRSVCLVEYLPASQKCTLRQRSATLTVDDPTAYNRTLVSGPTNLKCTSTVVSFDADDVIDDERMESGVL